MAEATCITISRRPIRERTVISSQSQIKFSSLMPSGRPNKYKAYDEDKLYSAYEEVVFENVPVRQAAMLYGVPATTLRDRVSGRVPFGKKSGPTRYLTDEEEDELVCFVIGCAEIGYSYTRKDILELVQEILIRKEIFTVISHGWWEAFKKRHPEITLRKPELVSHVRANCAQVEVIQRYFDELEAILTDNKIFDSPSSIFNMDESGFPLDPKLPHVICKRGQRHPTTLCSGNKSQITVLACCNAAGYVIPPFVIFDRKILKAELTVGEVPETMYGLSGSGWIDSELFDAWFQNHFLSYAPASRPLLLILDGHSSHFNPATLRRAAEEKVIMFCLPPNTTHKTQPLDKGCFGPLKISWREECHSYLQKNKGKIITRFQFSEIFSKAWKKGMTSSNVMAGFRTTGIYPFNPDKLIPKTPKKASSLCQKTGLSYIPFYSPRPRSARRPLSSDSPIDKSTDSFIPSPVQPDTPHSEIPVFNFTSEELTRYQRRKDEGFDLPGDERYQQWLRQFSRHSTPFIEENNDDESNAPVLSHTSTMASLLSQKTREIKLPKPNVSTSSRVLTSVENLKRIKEKEMKKQEEMKEKEKRKLEREAKKKEQTIAGKHKIVRKKTIESSVKPIQSNGLLSEREKNQSNNTGQNCRPGEIHNSFRKKADSSVRSSTRNKASITDSPDKSRRMTRSKSSITVSLREKKTQCVVAKRKKANANSERLKEKKTTKPRNISSVTAEKEEESFAECPVCGLMYGGEDDESVWICCDCCQAWFNIECTYLSESEKIPEEYFCEQCLDTMA